MSSLRITRIGPGASVQDGGRPGHMHEGVPPGGALCPELLALANASLGNAFDAPALELPWHGASFVAEAPLLVSLDGSPSRLEAGESFEIRRAEYAVRYLALPGGVDAPLIMSGRGALPAARIGRFALKGDVLRAGGFASRVAPRSYVTDTRPIRLVLGPDRFPQPSIDRLLRLPFTVSRLVDRTGMRLDERLPTPLADRGYSTPMVRGAIQVTGDGTPIILGPDHPTTGGYPVIAVVHSGDVGALAQMRPGQAVRFVDSTSSFTRLVDETLNLRRDLDL